ncbi:MAG: M50 family metallopeptidase [Vicinamibacteraceae bacterium]
MPRLSIGRSGTVWLWAAAAASLAVSLTPAADTALYPFRLFTTWVHEGGHALATVLVGGHVSSIVIRPDASGLTLSLVPDSRLLQGVVASAGYCGAALVGCLLIAATRVERRAHTVLGGLGACMLLTLLLWVRNPFGAVVVLAWAVAFLLLARRGLGRTAQFLVGLLAVQVALNAVFDIRVLYLVDGPSDAVTMARLFLLPAWLWASAWMLLALGMLAATIWMTRARR